MTNWPELTDRCQCYLHHQSTIHIEAANISDILDLAGFIDQKFLEKTFRFIILNYAGLRRILFFLKIGGKFVNQKDIFSKNV